MPVQEADLDGFLVHMLQQLATVIGFRIEWSVVTPPTNLLQAASTDGFTAYAFAEMNQTCSLWPSPASSERRLYFRQTVPLLSYNFQVITTRPQYDVPTKLQRIFYWAQPFSAGLWCLLMASIVIASIAMPLFERGISEQFSDVSSKGELVGHSLYLSAMGPSKFDTFEPSTAGGRFFGALHAFSLLLIISSYTANLAAQYTTSSAPKQAVSGISSLVSPDLAACARSSNTLTVLLNSSYPDVLATLTPANTFELSTLGSRHAVEAMLGGSCAGAVVPSTEASWILNVNDTRGDLCGAVAVGSPVGEEGMPLTFSKSAFTDAQLEAMNSVLIDLQRSGEFMQPLLDQFFPTARPQCNAADAADAAAAAALQPASQLETIDLSGAFLLQAIGLVMGVLLHLTKEPRSRFMGGGGRPLQPAEGEKRHGKAEGNRGKTLAALGASTA